MEINLKNLKANGFEVILRDEHLSIYPREHREILKELAELTELPKRDLYFIQEEISDLQIICAMRESDIR